MITQYFSFGLNHTHKVNGITWDADIVCAIEAKSANDARDKMFEAFGPKWSLQYDTIPDMRYFPRGIAKLERSDEDYLRTILGP